MTYLPLTNRYETMPYARVGKSGLKLPRISLGLWNNFGGIDTHENSRAMVLGAFDLGITHMDLANNYGPPPGSAEETFGRIMHTDLKPFRDELVVSTKAGYNMWSGPYGEWGSRKSLIASLDQSLKRMGLEYVDIFYSHRFDPDTPLEETMGALDQVVRQGKALYVGISNYNGEQTRQAAVILKKLGTPCLIHQPYYHMFSRAIESDLQDVLDEEGIGSIAFCPLAQGLLTDKYLMGIPDNSRLAKKAGFINETEVSPGNIAALQQLNRIAKEREQTLAQMALAWVLRGGRVTSALIGASRVTQIEENVKALNNLDFTADELARIEAIITTVKWA
ncbi:aldo/keto reductase [Paraburkholderia caffeinilytica]|uniref:aldo/keto reductase n=1 Tax=Paraburkholderia caffeinilytica TaxID=1761016 RepID=UPI003DA1BF10